MVKKVMLVDDAAFMRMMLKDVFKAHPDYDVVEEAENGLEAVAKYKEYYNKGERFDLVLLDITMPEMDGIKALKHILEFDKEAVVIMCSAMKDQEHVIEAMQLGAKSFIAKPFKKQEVIEKIERTFNQ
jgi:two-component system, chemotaxis family, chemotaxis protein CheY